MLRRFFLFVFILWGAILFAQLPDTLTLEECIRLAKENSFQLKSDEYEVSAAENYASIAETKALPRINGELALDNKFLRPYYFNQMWATVHADWSLGDFIKKTDRSSIQDIETRKLEKEQHSLNVIGHSVALYISILQVSKQIEILGAKVNFLEHHYGVSRGMWMAGLRSELDMMQTNSEIARMREDSARLAMTRNDLSVELVQVLGGDSAEGLHLASLQLNSFSNEPIPEISLENLANNPILTAYDSRIKAEHLRMDEISAAQMPHITMGSGYVKDADPTGDGNYAQISAGINIPIYSGKVYSYQRKASQSRMESLDARQNEAERQILIHLLKIRDKMVNTLKLMELQKNRLEISARALDYAEINYEAGITSNIELITSQQQLVNTELEIEETRLEYAMNLIEFYITNNQVDQIRALGNYQTE